MLVMCVSSKGSDWWLSLSKDVMELVRLDLQTSNPGYRAEVLGWLSTAITMLEHGMKAQSLQITNNGEEEIWSAE